MRRRVLISIFCVVAFLAVAALLCSFLFAVREIRVEFGSADAAQLARYEEAVKGEADYIRGKNILFLNEAKLAETIQRRIEDVEVYNVVRSFPNVVTIEANVRYPHAYLELTENGAVAGYAVVDNTLRVRSVVTTQPAGLIRLACEGLATVRAEAGAMLEARPAGLTDLLVAVFDAFAWIRYSVFDCVALIDAIDVTPAVSTFGKPTFDLTIRTATGASMVIVGADLLAEKIRYATSAYNAEEGNKSAGVVIRAVTDGTKRDKVTCTVGRRDAGRARQ